jgi:hypothetical protein
MTPKEKAIDLVNKYLQVYDGRVNQAKLCAFISVNEIIEEIYDFWYGDAYVVEWEKERIEYWDEVRNEIEKL